MASAILGGVLIGAAAVWLMASLGRIAGISGILPLALKPHRGNLWALCFALGLGVGGLVTGLLLDLPVERSGAAVTAPLLFGGLLVGFGTRLGSGCTSGHGVCGNARFSARSLVSTVVFLSVGMLTATVFGL